MVANTNPVFIRVGQIEWDSTYLTAANTTADLTSGTIYLAFTADPTEGSYLQYIRCKASPGGNNVQTVARFWINDGDVTGTADNNTLFDELTLPATTASSTTAVTTMSLPVNVYLPPGYRVYVTIATAVAAGWKFTGVGGKY